MSESPPRTGALSDASTAERYDREVVPRFTSVFGKLLLDNVDFPPKSTTLEIGSGTGALTVEMVRKIDETSRVIAIERSGPAMDLARRRLGALAGRRVFLKGHRDAKLNFAPEVFDRVVANLFHREAGDPVQTLREVRRVLKRGGRVSLTMPLKGSYVEVFDLAREVLLKFEVEGASERLDALAEELYDERRAVTMLEVAGFSEVTFKREIFQLTFRSGREFLADAVVEAVLLGDLRRVGGTSADRVLWHLRAAIDTYFAGSTFPTTVIAGAFFGARPAVGVEPPPREPSDGAPWDDDPTK